MGGDVSASRSAIRLFDGMWAWHAQWESGGQSRAHRTGMLCGACGGAKVLVHSTNPKMSTQQWQRLLADAGLLPDDGGHTAAVRSGCGVCQGGSARGVGGSACVRV